MKGSIECIEYPCGMLDDGVRSDELPVKLSERYFLP